MAAMLSGASPTDLLVLALVAGGRLLLPLLIPWFPLPAIVACLLLDGIDQTLFQSLTRLPLEGYQTYDKALDIYYLSIAYLSTLRTQAGLRKIERGLPQDNYLNPKDLNKLERELLRDSFKIVNEFKKFVAYHFKLGMIS